MKKKKKMKKTIKDVDSNTHKQEENKEKLNTIYT